MKTVRELYVEIMANDEQKRAFVEAMKAGKLEDFLKAHDCEATEEEVREFIETKAADDTPLELSVDELERIAGGTIPTDTCCCTHDTCGCSDTCIRDCC
jgi:predicted house-cleaning noncanonical NTP pyrophosphatase (MazG superfamily)